MNPLDQLPDFEKFAYAHIKTPSAAKLIAWKKAEEAERRMAFYQWAESHNDQRNPKHLVLLDDALSAFVLAFEAAIQHAKDQYVKAGKTPKFDDWFSHQNENDVVVKGVRTLRHFDAHVQAYTVAANISVHLDDPEKLDRRWSFQLLSAQALRRLRHAPLKTTDLSDWNKAVKSTDTAGMMRSALDSLNALLLRLEPLV